VGALNVAEMTALRWNLTNLMDIDWMQVDGEYLQAQGRHR
jgi:hypothetical protein